MQASQVDKFGEIIYLLRLIPGAYSNMTATNSYAANILPMELRARKERLSMIGLQDLGFPGRGLKDSKVELTPRTCMLKQRFRIKGCYDEHRID